MTKNEFLKDLRHRLSALSLDEQDAAVSYYEEYFDEAGPEREEEILRQLGSAEKLASEILNGQSFEECKNRTENPKRNSNILKIVLIAVAIILSPVVITAGGGILGGLIGVLAAAVAIVIAVAAVGIALGIGGISALGWGIFHSFIAPLEGLAFIGAGLIMFAISILSLYLLGLILCKLIPAACRGFVSLVRRLFAPAVAA